MAPEHKVNSDSLSRTPDLRHRGTEELRKQAKQYYRRAIEFAWENKVRMVLLDRRTIVAALAFGFAILVMLGAMSMTQYPNYPLRYSEAVFSESISPDEQWSAALIERRCGDDPLIIHVNVRRVGDPIRVGYWSGRADKDDIFALEQENTDPYPTVEWNTPRQLTIRCPGCPARRVKMRQEQWGPITVHYE